MMLWGAAGFLCFIIAAILVVQALYRPPEQQGIGTLTTAWAHFLSPGDSIIVPGDGLCVVTEVINSTTVRYEAQHRHG